MPRTAAIGGVRAARAAIRLIRVPNMRRAACLAPARDRQRIVRHILHDDAAGGHQRPRANLHRRDKRAVDADERTVPDHGAVLVHAVMVAGDGAGADIRPRTDAGWS